MTVFSDGIRALCASLLLCALSASPDEASSAATASPTTRSTGGTSVPESAAKPPMGEVLGTRVARLRDPKDGAPLPPGLLDVLDQTLDRMNSGTLDDYIKYRREAGLGVPPIADRNKKFWAEAVRSVRGAVFDWEQVEAIVSQEPFPSERAKYVVPPEISRRYQEQVDRGGLVVDLAFSSLRTLESAGLREGAPWYVHVWLPGSFPRVNLRTTGELAVDPERSDKHILVLEFVYDRRSKRYVHSASALVGLQPGRFVLPPFP